MASIDEDSLRNLPEVTGVKPNGGEIQVMPEAIQTISGYTPAGAAVESLADSWIGNTPQTNNMVVLAAWTLACGAVAIRAFRWN